MNEDLDINLTMTIGHRYRDSNGDEWKCLGLETRGWKFTSGSPPLTKTKYFDDHGKGLSSMTFPLVLDLGSVIDEPAVTSVVADVPVQPTAPPSAATRRDLTFSHELFNELIASTVQQIQSLSTLKGGEYSGDSDRLANFRRNADAFGTSMELVWAVYAFKHIDAIRQYINDLQSNKTRPRLESLAGRADDIIVYMILFKAMLIEAGVK